MVALLAICGLFGLNQAAENASADIININFVGGSDMDGRYAPIALMAGQWWNDQIAGWNRNLPGPVLDRLKKIDVDVIVQNIDGVGGILGGANATDFLTYRGPSKYGQTIVLSQGGEFTGDAEDFEVMSNLDILAVMVHEIGHVIGYVIPEIAEPMALTDPDIDNGSPGIVSPRALAAYREATNNPFATFATLEKLGGGGTAGVHPDSLDPAYLDIPIPGTNRTSDDIMIGFFGGVNFFDEILLSKTMLEFAHDMGFVTWVSGELFFEPTGGDGRIGGRRRGRNGPKNPGPPPGGGFLRSQGGISSVPEPSSMVLIGIVGVCGLGLYRRRK